MCEHRLNVGPQALLDLLAQLLQFDPRKRPSAAEALAHPYLAAYREAPEEGLPTPEMEFGFESDAPTIDDLRAHIWEEVLRFHPDGAPHGRQTRVSAAAAALEGEEEGKRCKSDGTVR